MKERTNKEDPSGGKAANEKENLNQRERSDSVECRQLFDAANSIILRWDSNGILTFVNPFGLDFFEYTAEELIGHDVMVLVPNVESTGRNLENLAKNIVADPEAHRAVPNENITKSGKRVWVSWTNKAILDEKGNVLEILAIGNDITALKETESRIRELSLQRQLALDAANMGWWHYDPITRIARWDDRYKEIFGVSGYERPNDEILQQIIHPDDLPELWAKVEAALDPVNPQPYSAEYRINRPDGIMRWIEAHGVAEFEGQVENRRAISFVGTVADITERKHNERLLRESLTHAEEGDRILSALMEYVPEGITIADSSLNLIRISDFGRDLLGGEHQRESVEAVADRWNVYHKDGTTPMAFEELPLVRAVQKGEVLENVEIVEVNNRGEKLHLLCASGPILDSEGDIVGGIVAWRDNTERVRLQAELQNAYESLQGQTEELTAQAEELQMQTEELQTSNEELRCQRLELSAAKDRWEQTFNSVPDLIAVLDGNHRIIQVNKAMAERLGVSPDDCVGLSCHEVVHGTAVPPEFCPHSHAMADGSEHMVEVQEKALGGHFLVSATPMHDRSGNVVGSVHVARDIGQQKQAEEQLRRLSHFPEQNPNPVLRVSSDGILMYANAASQCLLDLWSAAVNQRIPQYICELVLSALESGQVIEIEESCYHQIYALSLAPIVSEGYVNFYGYDITDRKRAEEALRESEERLKRAQEIAHLGSWELDLTKNKLTWSDETYRIFGLEPQEFGATYEAFLEAVHPDDRRAVDNAYTSSIAERRDMYEHEHRIVRKDSGEVRYVHEKCEHTRDSVGRIVRSIGMVHDITESREAQAALRESEARYRNLFDSMSEGFSVHEIICDDDGNPIDYRFLEVNPAFERLTGLDAKEIIGKTVLEVLPGTEPVWIQRFGKVALTGEPVHFEDHSAELGKWYEVYSYQPQSGRFAVVFLDVTERKNAEMERKERETELQRLNETLEQRVSERAAEIEQQADRLRALASELSQAEQRERRRLAKILHDHLQQILVAARIQLGMVRKNPDRPAAESTLQAVDSMIKDAIDASRTLTVELCPPVLHEAGLAAGIAWIAARMEEKNMFKVNVRADNRAEPGSEDIRVLLFECVRELLLNSMKHSGVREAEVIMSRTPEHSVRIVVQDQGCGFDPTTLRSGGTTDGGFGLFSIQQRLAYCGGRMEVEAAPGEGLRITLLAPLGKTDIPAEGEPSVPEEEKAMRVRERRKRIRILLADDHRIVREGLAGLIEFETDMEVVGEASDGAEAVELAQKLDPDVVVMDVNMPNLSGIEATRAITDRAPQVKIVGMSMYNDKDISEAMREAGASSFVAKGGPTEDLIAAIRIAYQESV